MARRRKLPAPSPSVNITSLCDIMLSLLIFFMLVSKAGVDVGIDPEIQLPYARLGIEREDISAQAGQGFVILNVAGSAGGGGIAENPRVYGTLFGTGRNFEFNVVNPNTGQPELRTFLTDLRREGGENFEVFIRAPAGTFYYDIQPILQAVNAARITRINYPFQSNVRPLD